MGNFHVTAPKPSGCVIKISCSQACHSLFLRTGCAHNSVFRFKAFTEFPPNKMKTQALRSPAEHHVPLPKPTPHAAGRHANAFSRCPAPRAQTTNTGAQFASKSLKSRAAQKSHYFVCVFGFFQVKRLFSSVYI